MKSTIWWSLYGSMLAKWIPWSHHGAWWSFDPRLRLGVCVLV